MKLQFTVLLSFVIGFAFAQAPGDLPPNAEPGKCYAKCLVNNYAINEYEVKLPVYTGDKYDDDVEREWRDLVEIDENGERNEVYLEIVLGEFKTEKIEYRTFVTEEMVDDGPIFSEWYEVLCENKITSSLIQLISRTLNDRGYLDNFPKRKNQSGSDTMEALKQFQIENNLPIGNLDIETLNALGVDY